MPIVTCVEVLDAHVQWDPGGFLPIMSGECELARRPQCQSGNDTLLRPEHAIAWGQAMFCWGGSVTPGVLPRLHMKDGLGIHGPSTSWTGLLAWIGGYKRSRASKERASNRTEPNWSSTLVCLPLPLVSLQVRLLPQAPRVWCYHKHLVSISRPGSRRWPRDISI